ncbi:DUF6155 family protein [Paenibacillus sp. OAS669]|uniref:DUF6155 family protein n=1 Tax=Paenibacillus sp. OAS669 TaxID=2663821 RepID=UPI0017897E9D|nr:DUF6155 family protein [Paenibacillus sp. OAS669]MBE1446129.1 TusA-related sulfurtransferase [Paenibacillus sp. OAS669]
MTKLSLPELKKQLKTYKTEELVSIIIDCYKSSPDVKKYIHMMLEPESTENQLFDETKKKILHQFYPDRGEPKLKLAEAKKAISEFTKLSNNQARTIDLMIYYVELGVEFTNDFGDMYASYYASMVSMYQNALNKISSDHGNGLYYVFQERLRAIVQNTSGIGWGFHDELADLFYEFAADYEEDPEDD